MAISPKPNNVRSGARAAAASAEVIAHGNKSDGPIVAAVYNRASFRDAKTSALLRWHQLLAEIVHS
jgi:hypothetical protein